MPSLWEHKNHSSVWCTYWLVEPESDCFFAGLNLRKITDDIRVTINNATPKGLQDHAFLHG